MRVCLNSNKKLREKERKKGIKSHSFICDTSQNHETHASETVIRESVHKSPLGSTSTDVELSTVGAVNDVEVYPSLSSTNDDKSITSSCVTDSTEDDSIRDNACNDSHELSIDNHDVRAVKKNKKLFRCLKCNKPFAKKAYALKHCMKKPWSCGNCGKTINHKQNIERHVKSCIPRKPCNVSHPRIQDSREIICTICKVSFISNSNMQRHTRKFHSNVVEEFMCHFEECSFSAKAAKHLKRHITSMHSTKSFIGCDLCEFECISKSGLVKHKIDIHGKQCPICDKMLLNSVQLNIHKFKVHGLKVQLSHPTVVVSRILGEQSRIFS